MFSSSNIYICFFLLFYIKFFSFSKVIEIIVDEKGSNLSCEKGAEQNYFHSISSLFLCFHKFLKNTEIIIFLRNDESLVFNLTFPHQLELSFSLTFR